MTEASVKRYDQQTIMPPAEHASEVVDQATACQRRGACANIRSDTKISEDAKMAALLTALEEEASKHISSQEELDRQLAEKIQEKEFLAAQEEREKYIFHPSQEHEFIPFQEKADLDFATQLQEEFDTNPSKRWKEFPGQSDIEEQRAAQIKRDQELAAKLIVEDILDRRESGEMADVEMKSDTSSDFYYGSDYEEMPDEEISDDEMPQQLVGYGGISDKGEGEKKIKDIPHIQLKDDEALARWLQFHSSSDEFSDDD